MFAWLTDLGMDENVDEGMCVCGLVRFGLVWFGLVWAGGVSVSVGVDVGVDVDVDVDVGVGVGDVVRRSAGVLVCVSGL